MDALRPYGTRDGDALSEAMHERPQEETDRAGPVRYAGAEQGRIRRVFRGLPRPLGRESPEHATQGTCGEYRRSARASAAWLRSGREVAAWSPRHTARPSRGLILPFDRLYARFGAIARARADGDSSAAHRSVIARPESTQRRAGELVAHAIVANAILGDSARALRPEIVRRSSPAHASCVSWMT